MDKLPESTESESTEDTPVIPIANRRTRKAIASYRAKIKRFNSKIFQNHEAYMDSLMDRGKIDYSLYNLVMERVDMTKTKNTLESLQLFYQGMWGYMAKLIRDNHNLRSLIAKLDEAGKLDTESLDVNDTQLLVDVMESVSDPLQLSHKVLSDMKSSAKTRANLKKKGIVLAKPPKFTV